MKPEGHFVTALAASAGVYALTNSVEMSSACFFGGFLIDVDHYFDYVVFDKQYNLNPFRFLRHYLEGLYSKVVLLLHSYELMALLTVSTIISPHPIIIGYLLGALMHLALDISYNGKCGIKKPALFYFFTYRALNNFDAHVLINLPNKPERSDLKFPVPEPKSTD